jgi:hypothetical protein
MSCDRRARSQSLILAHSHITLSKQLYEQHTAPGNAAQKKVDLSIQFPYNVYILKQRRKKMELSNQAMLGLGIYIGYKASYRRDEMARYGIEYDEVVTELTANGLIDKGRIQMKEAAAVFAERFPGQLASQVHQYRAQLGY